MGKKEVVKTRLENPPETLVYAWGEPYQRFEVKGDIVEGLSPSHPRWKVLEYEWKLEVEEVKNKPSKKSNSPKEVDNG